MHVECNTGVPAPWGTVHPCGCVARAIKIECDTCQSVFWSGTYTPVDVGEQETIHGSCRICGADISGQMIVHKQPPVEYYGFSLN